MPVYVHARSTSSIRSRQQKREREKKEDDEEEGEYSPSLYIKRIIRPPFFSLLYYDTIT
jgi:hypothetical protein